MPPTCYFTGRGEVMAALLVSTRVWSPTDCQFLQWSHHHFLTILYCGSLLSFGCTCYRTRQTEQYNRPIRHTSECVGEIIDSSMCYRNKMQIILSNPPAAVLVHKTDKWRPPYYVVVCILNTSIATITLDFFEPLRRMDCFPCFLALCRLWMLWVLTTDISWHCKRHNPQFDVTLTLIFKAKDKTGNFSVGVGAIKRIHTWSSPNQCWWDCSTVPHIILSSVADLGIWN